MSLLNVNGLNKIFGKHYALSNVQLDIAPGEVHALVGENGAGKSTLIKIVTGVYSPDGGTIMWKGKPVTIDAPIDAREIGINVVHQDRHLVPSFTGYENLYLGLPYPKAMGVAVDWKAMKTRAKELMKQYSVSIDMNKTVARMTPPEKTMLEILRAMMMECHLLILDEPTAALTNQESEQLFTLINRLTERGTAILYVSHRMDEIFRLSDRITVFRNGSYVATVNANETSKDQLISLMNNKEYRSVVRKDSEAQRESVVLEVNHLSSKDQRVKDISFRVHEGEIVGMFGLAGAGRTELLETIYGLRQKSGGEVKLQGQVRALQSPRESLDAGVVLIPEERKRDGIVLDMSIRENMTLPLLKRFANAWRVRLKDEKAAVRQWGDSLQLKFTGTEQKIGELSGGNQQKVVFAKALMQNPVLFLCDEPTQAVDIMTRDEIHRLLRVEADKGAAVLYVSSDLQEILDVADRIYVLHQGNIVAHLTYEEATPEKVLAYCFGQRKD